MMRAQQAVAFGPNQGYLPADHYDQIFTAHGVIMIFFVAMPLITGLMNYIVPLQIGARDVAFPFLNNFSFWMTTSGAVLTMVSLFVGVYARTGRSEEHTSEPQSLMRTSYAAFCLKTKQHSRSLA